jgi:hypothetical protein
MVMGASLPLAPAAGAAELPAGGTEVEVVVETDGGLLDLGLFEGVVPGPVGELVGGVEVAVPPVAGETVDEVAGNADDLPDAPVAVPTTTTSKATAAPEGGATTTTRPKGVVDDKGTGDSGYDENLGRSKAEAQDPSVSKGAAATPAPKPAPAPARRNRSRFALSGANVMFLAATGIGLVALGLSFRSLRWQRRGRTGRSN